MITDRATAALVPMRIRPTKPTARRTLTLPVRRRSRCTLDRPARRRNAEVAIYHGGASTTWRATSRQETSIQAFCCCGVNCGTNIVINCFYYCISGEGVRRPGQMASAQPRHYAPQQTRGGARNAAKPNPRQNAGINQPPNAACQGDAPHPLSAGPVRRRIERTLHRVLTLSEGHLFTPAGRADVLLFCGRFSPSPLTPDATPRQPVSGLPGAQLSPRTRWRDHAGTC